MCAAVVRDQECLGFKPLYICVPLCSAAGKFQGVAGETGCENCPMGKAQKATSQASCESCEEGKYSASEGELVCESCAQGTWSSDGSSKCELAADNYYLDPKSKESTPCPDNMECEGNLALPRPRTDYWVDRKLLEFAAIAYQCPYESLQIRRCHHDGDGYSSLLCS